MFVIWARKFLTYQKMANSLKSWWQGLKHKTDYIVFFMALILSFIWMITSFGKTFTNITYILLLTIVICIIHIVFRAYYWEGEGEIHKKKLHNIFFSDEPHVEVEHICQKCGSTNWTYPNPLKPADSMLNLYQLVNVLRECKDCGFIGMFLEIDKNDAATIKKIDPKEAKPTRVLFGSWLINSYLGLIAFLILIVFIYFLA